MRLLTCPMFYNNMTYINYTKTWPVSYNDMTNKTTLLEKHDLCFTIT